ncbi:UDP-N-acetylglucosamine--N-acetylmuramyl-(pentapeptide) pyrophosphoryl-undecaprenol N-acetylglucosamine transferase [Leucobacter luti]|uniref:UDP-N-acetylglucosamine--N-acetylmuramyl-(pentapeptide) pyrophosphoryl-undecaprenol N-acetylglucosamine transferase n=1 Tax=Leucobacter luti TaxID=340320 RepID=A0A4Q7TKR6_9MICO|nr:UDP-N-acetylglucosamine--N-acetylmuramyl-(pentapeptide) pyrophosphoryl-undecaprenol N-acetylglucosamine transferase [Leucobacter luti]MBL3700109.1 UDP-N-acetylglucosamine--N-acetylmuramyl-(pentapeptide) pyrophosphoryl-undecaprenol N-acetylglucosamine transferase [Leucobacter luti]RZT61171.1 UDP-N-acetylglucosamine-N-acetylmuramylpentapeptide N-acetylglucosamine transferase [Leucobacter luti]
MTRYLLAGGGTAGHVNPLLALADLIRASEADAEIVVLGTREGLEARLVPERGYELAFIERLPFPRRPNLAALKFPARYARAVREVRELIRTRSIDVVVGFGGYASAPAYRAGAKEGIPVVVHEANARPGMANTLGARSTPYVAVTFAGTPIRNARVTGMPLRPEITSLDRAATRVSAREHFGLDPERRTLLVTGGSLGARAINRGISGSAREIVDAGVQVLHVWGGLTEVEDPGVPGYHVFTYCDRMDLAFAACDLAVSRAGSTTVSELAGLGVPAVFVPYAVGNGEQRFNAAGVVEAGGALLVEDSELTPEWVRGTLLPLLADDARLADMSRRASSAGTLDGTERLLDLVREALAARAAA